MSTLIGFDFTRQLETCSSGLFSFWKDMVAPDDHFPLVTIRTLLRNSDVLQRLN